MDQHTAASKDFFSVVLEPKLGVGRLFRHCYITHNHTHTHTAGIVWTTDQLATKIASSQCKQTQQTNIHGLSWIRNRDPSPRVATDLHLRSHSHRYQREVAIGVKNYQR